MFSGIQHMFMKRARPAGPNMKREDPAKWAWIENQHLARLNKPMMAEWK